MKRNRILRTWSNSLPIIILWAVAEAAGAYPATCNSNGDYSPGLTFKIYDNAALAGTPTSSGTKSSAELSLKSISTGDDNSCFLSGELLGSLSFSKEGIFEFDCQFHSTSTGFVWVDGHLVCQDGNAFRPNNMDNPLPISRTLPFRAHITSNDTSCQAIASLQVNWKEIVPTGSSTLQLLTDVSQTTNTPANNNDNVPFVSLNPCLPPAEETRDKLQRSLGYGWGAWLRHNMLSIVKLPEGIVVTPKLCQISTNTCLESAIPDSSEIRVGLFAYDRSYVSYHMAYQTANVSVEYSVQGGQLYFVMTTMDFPENDPYDYAVDLHGRYGWFRPGNVTITKNEHGTKQLTFSTPGFNVVNVTLTTDDLPLEEERKTERQLHNVQDSEEAFLRLLVTKPYQQIGFGVGIPSLTTDDMQPKIQTAKAMEQYRIHKKFGASKYAVAEAIQSTIMWSLIYNPVENQGLLLPVSRTEGWSFRDGSGASTFDWTYIIFDWDNIFASLLAGLDNKLIAYSNMFQVIKSKTAAGFVPNFATGGMKSQDRAEPAVGARAMLELLNKYNDTWAVEVVFDDLLDWNNWMLAKRILQPAGLVALGSYADDYGTGPSPVDPRWDDMQKARFESGMDNSPMYDGDLYDNNTHLMQLYDVGMSSLFVQEAYSLAELATAIGRGAELVDMLRARGDAMRDKIATQLWDAEHQIFSNKFPNGTFYPRISPTSFYPIFTGAASTEQAELMVNAWLLNSSRFCISPDGDFAGNDPDRCYWGLPSINAEDPAFMTGNNHYWRGYVWGPLAQLTWWSLQGPPVAVPVKNSDDIKSHVNNVIQASPIITKARKALCKQMEALMMSQWNAHRHICENYHPSNVNGVDCTGTRFYHWGALGGLIGMMEDGYW